MDPSWTKWSAPASGVGSERPSTHIEHFHVITISDQCVYGQDTHSTASALSIPHPFSSQADPQMPQGHVALTASTLSLTHSGDHIPTTWSSFPDMHDANTPYTHAGPNFPAPDDQDNISASVVVNHDVHEGDAVIQPAGAVARLYLPPPTMRETPVLSMSFTDGQGRGIRLDRVLQGDLQRLSDSGDRSFFQGFGEKCSIKIMLHIYPPFVRQKGCRRVKRGEYLYISRAEIVRKVAEVTRDFIKATPHFHTDHEFKDWSANSTLENFVLVELKKVFKATVQSVFHYRPSNSD